MPAFETHSLYDADAASLFAWHARPGAFERLLPPWEHMRVVSRHGGITDGSRLTFEIRRWPFKFRWEALHRDYEEGRQFRDVQVAGPFRRWVHTHRFEPAGDGRALLIDHVDYALPLGPVGTLVGGRLARRTLERTFAFRHRRLAADLARHRAVGRGRRLRVVLTGRTGFLLSQMAAFLSTGGHLVHLFPTVEDARVHPSHQAWGPITVPDAAALQQADAVVHMGPQALPALLDALERHTSRARTVVTIPTIDVPGTPALPAAVLEAALGTGSRRVAALLTPGVLAAHAAVQGEYPEAALTPSLDGPLIGLDDLIGAVHFALCDDGVRGVVDVTLPRGAATAGLPPGLARWTQETRVIRLLAPSGVQGTPIRSLGFEPLNPTLEQTVLAELGWPA